MNDPHLAELLYLLEMNDLLLVVRLRLGVMIDLLHVEHLCPGMIDHHHPDEGGTMILLPDHRQDAEGKVVRHQGGVNMVDGSSREKGGLLEVG
jgi:hypothetical protein